MPAALDVDREQVRMLVIQYGVREAARKLGLNENTVCAWSDRGQWLVGLPRNVALPPSIVKAASGAIKSPANALMDAMKEDATETRAAVLRIARRAVNRVGQYDDDELVQPEVAEVLNKHAKTASLAGAWQSQAPTARINLSVTAAHEPVTMEATVVQESTPEDDPLAGF